jgi:acrylyl-CoA reductase (NADPH)
MTRANRFKALILEEHGRQLHHSIQELAHDALPDGNVLVTVAYSSLNYKDALAVTGAGKIVAQYPMVPGIDLAGVVEESSAPEFKPGDQVLATGWGLGERHWGGYAQKARVKADWLLPVPPGLSLQQAMGIGTAGLTAMLSVMALEEHGLKPGGGKVIVTGAAGGLGSMAVAILAKLGYVVAASTGRPDAQEYLRSLGARQILTRDELARPSEKALESERWAGAIDSVGGDTLASLLRSVAHRGSIVVCGLAGGSQLKTTVFPFILRGVNLLGIASSTTPTDRRRAAWARLIHDLPRTALDRMMQVAPLEDVPKLSQEILQGRIRGRIVIDPNR